MLQKFQSIDTNKDGKVSLAENRAPAMAQFDRACLAETKRLSNQVLNMDLDTSMRTQEWLFRSYIGSEDNHQRIDALQAQLAAARKKS